MNYINNYNKNFRSQAFAFLTFSFAMPTHISSVDAENILTAKSHQNKYDLLLCFSWPYIRNKQPYFIR